MDRRAAEQIYDSGKETTVLKLLELDQQNQQLQNKIARLSKDSSTSSKPPSSDIVKPPQPSLDGKKKRRIGGQHNHQRHEHALLDHSLVDHTVKQQLDHCPHCGSTHLKQLPDQPPRRYQQYELPQKPVEITEYQLHSALCLDCKEVSYATLPLPVQKQGIFGPKLSAAMGVLKYDGAVSFRGIKRYCIDILKIPSISTGFLAKTIQKISLSLNPMYEHLLKALQFATVVNTDETRHKENGKLNWTWVFRTALFTFFKIDPSRGSQVLIEVLGAEFKGALGCDYFSAYRKYMGDFNILLQFCLAHLIRDVKFLITLADSDTKRYGQQLLNAYKKLFQLIHIRERIGEKQFQISIEKIRKKILLIAKTNVPSTKEARNLAKRFRLHGKQYFQFITTPGLDPTNNIAERAIRFIVNYRHISQGTRSLNGRAACERIWTALATCRQNNISLFDFLYQSLVAYSNDSPPPLFPVK
jgi:transposase